MGRAAVTIFVAAAVLAGCLAVQPEDQRGSAANPLSERVANPPPPSSAGRPINGIGVPSDLRAPPAVARSNVDPQLQGRIYTPFPVKPYVKRDKSRFVGFDGHREIRRGPAEKTLQSSIEAMNTNTNIANTGGSLFIPADPHGAAGPGHVVAVANVSIEFYQKDGTQDLSTSLQNFFTALTPANFTFDPKVLYDQYSDRWLVVTLERFDGTSPPMPQPEASRILLGVSDDADPNGTWYFTAIDALEKVMGTSYWFDYPGFAVDEEAIYITGNMFPFTGGGFLGTRLFIVDKGEVGGFYDGMTAVVNKHDPVADTGGVAVTLQPAHTYGAVPEGVGTWLISYSGLTDSMNPDTREFIQLIRIDDPLGAVGGPVFTLDFLSIEDSDDLSVAMPDTPQAGQSTDTITNIGVASNDRRALDVVFRNDSLWFSTTLVPPVGTDAGQATATWGEVSVDPANVDDILLVDLGLIGGEEIATGTFTTFPSVAVNADGGLLVGFSASAPTINPGAYFAHRSPADAGGALRAPVTLRSGADYYQRTFGGPDNRWGDYTAAAVDPDDACFWIYNKYAITRGNSTGTDDDGRWGTAFGHFCNDAPAVMDDSATVDSAMTVTVLDSTETSVLTNDNDPDPSDALAVGMILSGPTSASAFTLNADGTFSYTNDGGAGTTDQVTYEVCDDGSPSQCVTATLDITITGVTNVAPVAVDDGVAITDGGTIVDFDVTANDSDPNGDGLVVNTTLVTPPNFATLVSITAAGLLNYTHDGGGSSDSLVYEVCDDQMPPACSTATVTIAINNPPNVTGETLADVAEDTALVTIPFATLLANDDAGTGEGGQVISISAVSGAAGGSVLINGTDVEFTPTADFNGAAQFTYTVTDDGAVPAATDGVVTFTITEVNDAPAAMNQTLADIAEDAGLQSYSFASLLIGASAGPANEAGQALTISAVSNPVGGAVAINGMAVEFTPTADFDGAASFDFTVTDDGTTNGVADPLSDVGTASFTVTEVNDPPVAADQALADVAEDAGLQSYTFASLLTGATAGPPEESGQTLTISAVSNPVGGTVAINGTSVEFTPTAEFSGAASFDFTVTDDGTTNGVADPLSDVGTASFTITEVNDPPVAADQALADLAEGAGLQSYTFASLLAGASAGPANEAGQTLTISAVSNPVGGAVAINGANVEFTPTAEFSGAASFDFTVTDDGTTNGVADPQDDIGTASFTISDVNDPPTAMDQALADVAEDGGLQSYTFASLLTGVTAGPPEESGQTLTISAVSNPVGGTVAINGTSVEFAPTAEFSGAASFDFTVTDDGTTNGVADPLSDVGTASFTITEVNDPPVAADQALADLAEGAGLQSYTFASLLAGASAGPANEAGQTLTISAVSNPVGGTVAINGANVEFTPTAEFSGAASFDFTVTDDGTTNGVADPQDDIGTASFTISDVNDPPTAMDQVLADVAEDGGLQSYTFASLLTGATAGPPEESGQTLTISAVSNAVGGTVAINGTSVEFAPTAEFSGAASFDFTVTDDGTTNGVADPLSDVGTASFTVTEVNDPPVAADQALADLAEGAGLQSYTFASLLAGASAGPANEAGQTLTISAVSNPVGGTVAINGANVEFTPTAEFSGAASFDFTVTDDGTTNGLADPQDDIGTASFTISDVNDPPTAMDQALADVAEDGGLQSYTFASLLTGATAGPPEESGQTLTISAVSNPVGGTVAINGTSVEFAPTAEFSGAASFDFTVTDDGTTNGVADPLSDVGTASFTITEVNDPPVAADQALADLAEGAGLQSYTFASLLAGASAGPANEAGQTLTISAVSNAVGGTVAINGTNVEFTPTADFNGAASFDFTVTDDGTTGGVADPLSDAGTASFTITEVNDPPVAADQALADLAEGAGLQSYTFASLLAGASAGPANEAGQTLTISAVSNPVGGTVAINGANVEFTPTAEFSGAASFDFTVTDDGTTNGLADPQDDVGTASFTISDVNDPPTAMDQALADVAEDAGLQSYTFASLLTGATAGPPEESGQTLTISAVSNPVGGTVAINGTSVEFAPTAEFSGAASFDFTVTDDGTTNGVADPLSDVGTASFTVTEVNDPPVAADQALADLAEGAGLQSYTFASLLAGASAGPANEAGQTLTISAVSNPVGGTVAINGANVEFTPTAEFSGAASFDFTVTDDGTTNGLADPQDDIGTASFTISDVNDPPTAMDQALADVAEDGGLQSYTFASLLTGATAGPPEESGQTLTISAVSNPVGGTVAINGTSVEFAPTAEFSGAASFDFTVTDDGTTNGVADPLSDVGTASFTITEVNDPPVAADQALADLAEGAGLQSYTFASLLAGASAGPANEAGQTLTISAVSNPVGGTVAINGANVEFTPTAEFSGAASFDFTVTDDGTTNGVADPQDDIGTASFTISDVNDPPTAMDQALADVAEDAGLQSYTFASLLTGATAGPPEESGQTLTISAVSNAVGGTVAINGTSVEFAPTAEFSGAASFDFTVTDDGTTNGVADPQDDVGTASFTISDVNDPPTAMDQALADVAEDAGLQSYSFASLLTGATAGPPEESGQTLTISAVSNPVGGTVAINGTSVEFTLTTDFNGAAGFDFTVSDDGTTGGVADPLSDLAIASFAVTEVNDAPSAADDVLPDQNADAGPYLFATADLLANDAAGEAGQTLQLVAVDNPSGGNVALNGAMIEFSPTPGAVGAASFDYTISDDGTTAGAPDPLTDVAKASFQIVGANNAPTPQDDALTVGTGLMSSVLDDGATSLLDNDSDPDMDTLTVDPTPSSAPLAGSVVLAPDGQFEYTHDGGATTSDSFGYTVCDNGAPSACTTATVTITVNRPPIVVDEAFNTDNDVTFSGDVSTNDSDPEADALTYMLNTDVANGTLTFNADGTFDYTPDLAFDGIDSFVYSVSDGISSVTGAVLIRVGEVIFLDGLEEPMN